MSVMYSPAIKYSATMDSNIEHQQQHCHQQQNSGLLRYRSAPSSFLASLVDDINNGGGGGCVNDEPFRSSKNDPQHYVPSTSSEMDTTVMLSKLISSNNGWNNSAHELFDEKPVKQEEEEGAEKKQSGYCYGSELVYQSHQQIHGLPNCDSSSGDDASDGFDGGSFGVGNSITSGNSTQSIMAVGSCSSLIRQKSSPAGFFSNESGLAALREVGSFRASAVSNGQPTASTSGMHGALSFPLRPSSCLKRMPLIAENETENIEGISDQSRNLVNDNGSSKCYVPSFTNEYWDGSAFDARKTASEDEIMFTTSNSLESQDSDFCSQNLGLTHHLSLPSTSTKMASIEKFLQLQGTVPCKVRAKRGFATHPRSIAERVRRTKISERIKKLQGLFPKSDKQTSTADMLDLAVEYIKDLQEQVKMLTDVRAKCKCTSNKKQYS